MAPPQPKAAAKPAAAPAGGVKKAKVGKPRNYDLGNGVVRFSKSKMFHKKVSPVLLTFSTYIHSYCSGLATVHLNIVDFCNILFDLMGKQPPVL